MAGRLMRGFFHRDLSGTEAEKLLQEKAINGSFLVRPSTSRPDSYVLSVRRANGDITHIRIQRTNDGFDFGEGQDRFATLYDMIEHYRQNVGELKEKNNETIELTTPVLAQMPTLDRYYHGSISHSQASSLLMACDKVGLFLVRDSETIPGDYVISVKTLTDIANVKIKCLNSEWFLDGKGRREQIDRFKTLDDLIHYYLKHNILVATNGNAFRLVEPCYSNWFYAKDIIQRCEQLSKVIHPPHGQRNGFSIEFELLNQQCEPLNSTVDQKRAGEKPEYRPRNRFKNILPYDETRVTLKNYSQTDYINANRIKSIGPSSREYIATQGPLPNTIQDFWHMVYQENVKCIVMITREIEGLKNKCARYWPELHGTVQYGNISIENLSETNFGPHQIPAVYLTDDMQPTKSWDILHYQYLAWGDHGSPLMPTNNSNQRDMTQLHVLLDFFERFGRNKTQDALSPLVVHCSAGIGRSGATIAIDIILNKIQTEGLFAEIDIPGLIIHLRSQRSVQTERQYEFIYRVIEYFVERQMKQQQYYVQPDYMNMNSRYYFIMPTIGVKRSSLFRELGKTFTDEEFDELCFDFGIELDSIEPLADSSNGDAEYKIEIPANRYDLLCLEGLSRALKTFLHNGDGIPEYHLTVPSKDKIIRLKVLPDTQRIRPFVVGAVLRNVTFNNETYNSFIELQDKLHQNLCRERKLVAIGTHDLDTIQPPFIYDAQRPTQIKFKPLNQTREFPADELMEFYMKDSHLKRYVPLIRDSSVYPIIYDSKKVVLSLPPIINSDHSKINLNTKNIFIECTAIDLHKAKIVLDTVVTMFSQYCSTPFLIEAVEVEQFDGKVTTYPTLNSRTENVSVNKINQVIGINVDAKEAAQLLTRMCLKTCVLNTDTLQVTIPPTRADILHFCDIAEDCAVAYGFNKIQKTVPKTSCIGNQYEINRITDLLRHSVAECGFTEALTFTLCSCPDVAEKFGKTTETIPAVHIANPKTLDFQIGRTSLLPGLLRTVACNRGTALPILLFEVADVILKDNSRDTGSRNERRLCAIYYNKTPGFETIHGLLDRVMQLLKVKYDTSKDGYYLNSNYEDPGFFPGRFAQVIARGLNIGTIGVLHPDVIKKFDLKLPCSGDLINVIRFIIVVIVVDVTGVFISYVTDLLIIIKQEIT
ncbi:unnamed protein product [Didymodactylos carnosus]|uniref:Phenylalanine--tRNA ligase beta subunit n=1 Tax=Didymodactylos carnosus TaxID=1234261 RepID=A0A814TUE4_9BILA|nr:unnamed protein product [Didymodactylos carnosus]CAF3929630.1 unnamed protein product [Didymodactylos carnosus]